MKCERCDGKGILQEIKHGSIHNIPCGMCHGTGSRLAEPFPLVEPEYTPLCAACNGTGDQPRTDMPCGVCGGTGVDPNFNPLKD